MYCGKQAATNTLTGPSELLALARDSSGLLPDSGRAWRLEWLTNFLLDNFQYQARLDKRIKKAPSAQPKRTEPVAEVIQE